MVTGNDVECLHCGESYGAIRASQRSGSPIYCAILDYFGEVDYEFARHRFRSWTDDELHRTYGVKPEFADKYRRMASSWAILDEHRSEEYFTKVVPEVHFDLTTLY